MDNQATPTFTVEDPDLDQLLNVAADIARGEGNMDTALAFQHYLEKVQVRLQTPVDIIL